MLAPRLNSPTRRAESWLPRAVGRRGGGSSGTWSASSSTGLSTITVAIVEETFPGRATAVLSFIRDELASLDAVLGRGRSSAGCGVCGASEVVVDDVVRVGESAGMFCSMLARGVEGDTVRMGRVSARGGRVSLGEEGGEGEGGSGGSGECTFFEWIGDAGALVGCTVVASAGFAGVVGRSAAGVPATISPSSETVAPFVTGTLELVVPRRELRGDAGSGMLAGSTPSGSERPDLDVPPWSSALLGDRGGSAWASTTFGRRGETGLLITSSSSSSTLLSSLADCAATSFAALRWSHASRMRFASLSPSLLSLLPGSSTSIENRLSISASCMLMGSVSPFGARYRRGTSPRARSAASRCSAERKAFGCVGALGLGRWMVGPRLVLVADEEAAGAGVFDVDGVGVGCGVRSLVARRLKSPALAGWAVGEDGDGAEGMVTDAGVRAL